MKSNDKEKGGAKMKKSKILVLIILVLLLSLELTGCYDVIYLNEQSDTAATTEPISPYNENSKTKTINAVCYYAYNETEDSSGQEYLVSEVHSIDYSSGNYEKALLNELVIGPDQKSKDITSVIPKGTTFKIISKEEDRFIAVILSSKFLTPPSTYPTDWASRSDYVERFNRVKRLAVYSIVDTLTESGKYDRVQILIDYDDTGIGRIPAKGEMGFTDGGNQYELLEAMYRTTNIIFTPENATKTIMYYLKNKSYANLYEMTALVDLDGNKKPTQEEFIKTLENLKINVADYDATNGSTAPDGSTSTVLLKGEITIGVGTAKKTKYFENTTLRLIEEDGIWKIQYNDLINYLTN